MIGARKHKPLIFSQNLGVVFVIFKKNIEQSGEEFFFFCGTKKFANPPYVVDVWRVLMGATAESQSPANATDGWVGYLVVGST